MARKRPESSYKEKLYYDNTIFRGILATNDANNEGYFKQLINFDISDTGQSLQPRKGLLNTNILVDGSYLELDAEQTVYFKSPKSNIFFFVDFSKCAGPEEIFVYKVDLSNDALDDLHYVGEAITNIVGNAEEGETKIYLFDYYDSDCSDLYPIGFAHAEYAKDEFLIDRNIVKIGNRYENGYHFWLEMTYNEEDDSMIFTVVNTEDTVSIEMKDRNIASPNSIIPNPIQYVGEQTASTIFSSFPKIYLKKNNKYLLNKVTNLNDSVIIPYYNLINSDIDLDTEQWAYAYDIYSTKEGSTVSIDENTTVDKYESPVFRLNDDSTISVNMLNNYTTNITDYLDDSQDYYIDFDETHNFSQILNGTLPSTLRLGKQTVVLSTQISDLQGASISKNDIQITVVNSNERVLMSATIREINVTDGTITLNVMFNVLNSQYNITSYSITLSGTYTLINSMQHHIEYDTPSSSDNTDYSTNLYNELKPLVRDYIFNDTIIVYIVPKISNNNHILNWGFGIPLSQGTPYNVPFEDYITKLPGTSSTTVLNMDNLLSALTTKTTNVQLSITGGEDFYDFIPLISSYNNSITNSLINLSKTEITKDYFLNNESSLSKFGFLIKDTKEVFDNNGYLNNEVSCLFSNIIATEYDTKEYNYIEIKELLNARENKDRPIIFRVFTTRNIITIPSSKITDDSDLSMFLPGFSSITDNSDTISYKWNIYTTYSNYYFKTHSTDTVNINKNQLFYSDTHSAKLPIVYYMSQLSNVYGSYVPLLTTTFNDNTSNDLSIFSKIQSINNSLQFIYNENHPIIQELKQKQYFKNGFILVLYLGKTPKANNQGFYIVDPNINYTYKRMYFVNSTNLFNNIVITYQNDVELQKTNWIEETITKEPNEIKNSKEWCIFNSIEGYRLVTWYGNNVYMSEANNYNYFKYDNNKTYPEPVIKCIPYKDMVLVFTSQNAYSIFPYEITEQIADGYNEDGSIKYVQVKSVVYNTLPVLYNIMTTDQYKEVIQKYSNLILFYAPNGQLYLITPSVTIDSDTVFAMKIMNQSANDILLHYDEYINERLKVYELEPVERDDIKITADVTLEHIKIYYSIPEYNYTYILIYDVTNNRFTVYDTNICGGIFKTYQTDTGYIHITKAFNGDLGILTEYNKPNTYDNNYDCYSVDGYTYRKEDIRTELTTGIIALNNQWKKRLKTLEVIYKNINTHNLLFDLNLYVDDVPVHTCMSDTVELKLINGALVSETLHNLVSLINDAQKQSPIFNQTVEHELNMLEENTALFDFSNITSNKIIKHQTGITSIGKHINLQLRFKARGKYKVQGFSIIYKEHGI